MVCARAGVLSFGSKEISLSGCIDPAANVVPSNGTPALRQRSRNRRKTHDRNSCRCRNYSRGGSWSSSRSTVWRLSHTTALGAFRTRGASARFKLSNMRFAVSLLASAE